jgi:hypothetical protein
MQAEVECRRNEPRPNMVGPNGERMGRHHPFVYKLANGQVMVDFHVETRFTVEEWVELVREVNDRMFELMMQDGSSTVPPPKGCR